MFVGVSWSGAQEGNVRVALGAQGVQELSWRGHNFAQAEGDAGASSPEVGITFRGEKTVRHDKPTETKLDRDGTLLQRFAWGDLRVRCNAEGNEVITSITVSNHTEQFIDQVFCRLLDFGFPAAASPSGWGDSDPPKALAKEGPAALVARFGEGAVALVNDPDANQVACRWGSRDRGAYPVFVESNLPIFPHEELSFQLEFCFGDRETPWPELVRSVYARCREAHPFQVAWPDRRPIGSLFLAQVNRKWPGNPRGWFADPGLELRSEAGRDAFQRRLKDYAVQSITLLKEMNAQGMILWDLEGQEFPQGEATYAGDPMQVARLAPEMDGAANAFFAAFSSAGFRTGVCLRAQEIVYRANGSFYQRDYRDEAERFDGLDRKMSYAHQRWGCTLFYVDSNGGPHGVFPVEAFRRLQEKHPDCLICPEFGFTPYWAYTMPYRELRRSAPWADVNSTAPALVQVYPEGGSLINVADGDIYDNFPRLVEGVRRGDILLYRSWMRSREFDDVKNIYRLAKRSQ
ncbi:MAG TPA: hypothetical protein VGD78_13370 [Chthoniobacterales bacterium]